jgi:hypothetical protein
MHDGSAIEIDSINALLHLLRTAVAELERDHRKAAKAAERDVLGELG